MQKLSDKKIKIEGLALPNSIQIGINNRNDNGNNHIFENGEIKVLCSKCKEYHPVYRLEDRQWKNNNKTYRVSIQRDTKEEYFGTKCTQCYKNKDKQTNNLIETGILAPTVKKGEGEYLPHSKRNGGVQQTIFLVPDLDLYLKLYEVTNGIKKNELINQIIAEFRGKHPLNL